jgi:hypothetical protein
VLQAAAQTVEAELDGAEAHPVAAAIDARAPGFHSLLGGDREHTEELLAEVGYSGAQVAGGVSPAKSEPRA